MKNLILFSATAAILAACDGRVTVTPPDKVIEKHTTIINPPGTSPTEEKKTTTTTTETKR